MSRSVRGLMRSVAIRDEEMAAIMDALSQYLDNAAEDDDGEPIETPDYRTVLGVLGRLEAAFVAGRLEMKEEAR